MLDKWVSFSVSHFSKEECVRVCLERKRDEIETTEGGDAVLLINVKLVNWTFSLDEK